jgi:DNA-binding response OmpR family regulator
MDKKKILLVEDEADLRMFVAQNLESHGYEVYQAEDGEEGIKYVLDIKPDLIITDVLMPKMNGNEFVKKVRKLDIGKEIPFIVLTVRKLMKDYFEAINIEEFISKPFETKELVRKIEKIFNKKEGQEQADGKIVIEETEPQQPQQKPEQPDEEETHRYCNECNKRVPPGVTQCPHCGWKEFRDGKEY